jgi:hydrogenase expression/formation protein HypC
MCHAVPARVLSLLPGERAVVELGGARQTVSTAILGPVAPGEHVIVHVGFALTRLDEAEAAATLAALEALP